MPLPRAFTTAVLLAVLMVVAATAASAGATAGWQATSLGLPAAWQVTRGDPGVVVAVVDTGVEADHPSLNGHVLAGYDFVGHDADAADDNGHGTALAAIVAATCPECRILPVKVLDAHALGDMSTIAAGIAWAADHGAQVINLSIGSSRAPDSLRGAVSSALAKGVIVVAAAGNDGRDEPFFPAQYPGVVSVGGSDESGRRYGWSNFGSWVSVSAPGCTSSAWLSGGYTSDFCGTSTAAPFVAGVAGLARSLRPTLNAAEFAGAIAAATPPPLDAGTAAHGALDANRLLIALGAPAAAPHVASPPARPGAPRVGRGVVAQPGVWVDASQTTIAWQRTRDGRTWRTVATGGRYTPTRLDRGSRLRVVVTATNVRGVATAVSSASTAVAPIR